MPESHPKSLALERAIHSAEVAIPICEPCTMRAGLCLYHAEHSRATLGGDGVMPLAAPNIVNLKAMSGRWHELHRTDDPLSLEGQHIRDRKEKQRQRGELRLRRAAFAGEFTKNRPKVA